VSSTLDDGRAATALKTGNLAQGISQHEPGRFEMRPYIRVMPSPATATRISRE
jgi:hypothetical protein